MLILWNAAAVFGLAMLVLFLGAGMYLCGVVARSAVLSVRNPAPGAANVVLKGVQATAQAGALTAHGDAIHARQVN
jgi:hypothetical protein